ncbi:TonB-dependent receptor [Saccharicrinis sp. 156]|uniref:TonB-dependent receptor n=1 Tax=Saccharicrinis sp. 156 TaxID=3417574 RepID=UPI003D33EB9A
MQKLFLSILVSIIGLTSISSQYRVHGIVTGPNNNPLVGATVAVKGSSIGTITDAKGNYLIKNLQKGQYQLAVSYLGYETQMKSIQLTSDEQIDFTLKPGSIMTGEVIVSSIKAGNKTPVAKTDISKEELSSMNAADDIPLLLSMTPSVVSSTESGFGVGYSSMRIRGTDATRINVTVNGIPLNDGESQGVYWVNMPDFSSSVDEVQVQRGVGTSTNGAAAFGASINFNTTSYHTKPYAEVSSTAGSFNTFKNSINVSTGLLDDKFSFDLRYSDLQTDGYVDYAFSDHKSLYMSGSMHLKNSFLKANVIHGDQRTGISWWGIDEATLKTDRTYNPAGQYIDENGNERYYKDQTDNYLQTHYQLFFSQNLNSNWLLNTALHYTRGEGYYEQYKQDESLKEYGLEHIIRQPGDTIKTTDLIRQKWLTNDFYGFTGSFNYDTDDLQMTFGGGWNKYDGDHFGELIWARYAGSSEKGEEWYRNKGIKKDYNIYAKVNYQLGKLNVFGDVQYRGIDYKINGTDDDFPMLDQHHTYDFFNPKAGVFYTLNQQNQFYASYAIANREPARADFKNAQGDASSTPKSERLNDLEIGYHYQSPNLAANINFYYMDYKDQLIPTGEKSNVGYSIMTNVEDSYRTGMEIELGAKILSRFRWDGNATFSKNIIKDFVETYDPDFNPNTNNDIHIQHGDNQISYSPNIVANSTFTITPLKNTSIKFITKHVGEQYFDNTESDMRKLDAYTVFNGIITQAFNPSWMKKIELQLTVNNLFDTKYESNAYGGNWYEDGVEYSWAAYYPQAGTHAFIRARFIF